MTKNLQKTADFYRKKKGVLDPQQFERLVDLQFYAPAPKLAPFIAHYFVARWHVPGAATYTAADVLSQPAVHMLFTNESSDIMGVMTTKRTLELKGNGVYAGVRFKPGGFYPFWKKSMADIAEKVIPVTDLLPQADATFTRTLLTQTNANIAEHIEAQLLAIAPAPDEKVQLIGDIITAIETQPSVHTTQSIAKSFALGERSLQHLFTTYVGVGVKWVTMRTRFLDAIRHAHTPDKPNWTTIAAELGYSTQSHFVNDFKKVIGMSPSQYSRTIQTS